MPMSMLAVGFALRDHHGFTWANLAERYDPAVRPRPSSWERYPNVRRCGPIDPRELKVQVLRPEAVDRVVDLESPEERRHLLGWLHLPAFLQDLFALPTPGHEVLPVVFSHLNAIPAELVDATFSNPQVHATLHREGMSLLATFFGTPATAVRDAFDQVYRIEDAGGHHWTDAFVWSERGPTDIDLLLPRPLREVWHGLRLDPELLSE